MQNTKPGSSRSDQRPVPPQVRYHPSIQNPAGAAAPQTTNKTRTSPAQKAKPARRPQTGTSRTAVQEDEEAGSAGGRRDLTTQTGTKEPAATGTDVPEPAPTAAPSPEDVPLGVGLQLDQHVVDKVEVLTRGQRTNPDWFAWRRNRITASVAHCIARSRFVNGKSRSPPASYLSSVTAGEASRVQTRAMSWGVEMEATAVREYQTLKSAALGRPVSVQECGLFIDSQRPWLAASPDGIVTDRQTGQWLLCLEVKCPFKHRQKRVEDACRDDPAFCLQIEDEDRRPPAEPVYRLKTSHSYFTQIQCQLAVTGLKRADLVVFTLKETAVVPVTFDPELWEKTVSKLEVFYRDAVLPYIRQRTPQDAAAAAWTPEV